MTFSIVARDPETGALGVASASHFLAVGSIATFAEPGVGAIASQAFASRQYGPLGLDLLRAGQRADQVLDALLRLDDRREVRQVGVVDSAGQAAGHTGDRCVPGAGHRCEAGLSVQGNMLASEKVWDAMADAYAAADGDLAGRMLVALEAAEAAGGDARGRQSANLLIVGPEPMATPWNGVIYDVRVDDHPEPLAELRRIVSLRRTYLRLGAVLFDDGPLFDGPGETAQDTLEAALAELEEMEAELDGVNLEPALWRSVLLARAGRSAEAARLLVGPLSSQPSLATFVEGLATAGFLSIAAAAELTGQAP
jgi:uncharacterized Ntn-hydrolase superfamily protein